MVYEDCESEQDRGAEEPRRTRRRVFGQKMADGHRDCCNALSELHNFLMSLYTFSVIDLKLGKVQPLESATAPASRLRRPASAPSLGFAPHQLARSRS